MGEEGSQNEENSPEGQHPDGPQASHTCALNPACTHVIHFRNRVLLNRSDKWGIHLMSLPSYLFHFY